MDSSTALSLRSVHRLRHLAILLSFVTLSLLAGGCASTGGFNLISLDEEWRMGRQIEQDLAKQLTLVNDGPTRAYINRIGQQLVRQTNLSDRPWTFHVVADESINAFNVPGGHVYVHTGLINAVDNVAELTSVIAHEVAHGARRHGTKRLSQAYGFNIGAGLLLGQDPGLIEQIAAQVVGTGAIAHFSRADEREADRLGLRYMHRAGYNPEGMVTMFEKLLAERQHRPGAVGQFFSTHPLTEDRIEDVRSQLRQLPSRGGLITHDGELRSIQRRARQFS